MKFFESKSNNKYPELCCLIHDVPQLQINFFREYISKNPDENSKWDIPADDLDGDETYEIIKGTEEENVILELIGVC